MESVRIKRQKRRLCVLFAMVSYAIVLCSVAGAATTIYTSTTDSNWFTAGNWDNGVPSTSEATSAQIKGATGGMTVDVNSAAGVGSAGSDSLLFVGSNGANTSATLNILSSGSLTIAASNPVLTRVRIGSGMSSTGTINAGGNFNIGATLFLADSYLAKGNLNVSSGTTTINGALYLAGNSSQGTGNVNISGTGAITTGAGYATYIGHAGTGNWTQTGGTATIGSTACNIGSNAGSYGNVNLSGGTFNSSPSVYLGKAGTGTWAQTNGTTNITTFLVGYDTGSSGTFELSGGVANITNIRMTNGTSEMTLSGGEMNVANWIKDGTGTSTVDFDGGTFHSTTTGTDATFNFDVTNNGTTFAPGSDTNIGILNFNTASYTQNSTGHLAIGLESLASFDKVNLTSGSATLGGYLDVTALGVYTPEAGDYWDIMTTESGTISLDSLSVTSGYMVSLLNDNTTLRLSVVPEPITAGILLLGLPLFMRRSRR